MISEIVIVNNETGLHARPASLIVKEASKYKSNISIVKGSQEANAKSVLGIMAMAGGKGEQLEIRVDGPDEKEALEAIINLFNSNFGE